MLLVREMMEDLLLLARQIKTKLMVTPHLLLIQVTNTLQKVMEHRMMEVVMLQVVLLEGQAVPV